MALVEAPDASWFSKSFETLLGFVGGALVTFITLRTRLAMIDRDIGDIKKERVRDDLRMTRMENREKVMLRLLIDISQKVGVDKRFPDDMIQLLLNVDGQES